MCATIVSSNSSPPTRRLRLFDQIDFPRTGMSCGVFYRPFFHFGYPRGDRDDDARRNELPMMDLLDEVAEHRFGNFEVGDDAIFHGPNGHDVSRRATQHSFGLFAYGQ